MYRFCRIEAAGLVAEFRIEVKITPYVHALFLFYVTCIYYVQLLRWPPGAEEAKIILN